MADVSLFLAATVPIMVLLGVRHGLDVDHIAAIDNLVRMRSADKGSRWIGSFFSLGHMLSVSAEMVALVYVVKSLEAESSLQLLGGVVGAAALALIGGVNFYSLRRYGRSSFSILAQKAARRTSFAGTIGSPILIGFVFGLGFDTASQISALTVSAVASATQGVQIALVLTAFFALGMIPTDTLDSLVLREVFSRISSSGGFRTMSYGLSVLAISLALLEGAGTTTGIVLIPAWTGALLAMSVVSVGLSYAYYQGPQNKARAD
jgi:nickel/cobalt transporter (NiCoT) family protein